MMEDKNNHKNTINILQRYFDTNFLHQVFHNNLMNNAIVRQNVIIEYFPVVAYVDEMQTKAELTAFIKLLKALLDVLKVAIDEQEWDLVGIGFTTFSSLSIRSDGSISADIVKQLVQLIHTVISRGDVSNDVPYTHMVPCYTTLISSKPKLVQKSNLILSTIKLIYDRFGKDEMIILGGFSHVENLPEETDPKKKALMDRSRGYFSMIDVLTTAFPHHVGDVTMRLVQDGLHSIEYSKQIAAVILAAASVEGLADRYSESLEELLPLFLSYLKPNEKKDITEQQSLFIREMTVFTIGLFAVYVQPVLISHAKFIIPLTIPLINDSLTLQITTSSLYDTLLESVHPMEIKHYLPRLFPEITFFFQKLTNKSFVFTEPSASLTFNKVLMIHTAFRSLSAVILGAEHHILPYQTQIIDLLKPFLQSSEQDETEEMAEGRGSAIDTLSHLILMSGSSQIDPEIIELGAEIALNQFSKNKNEKKRENSFVFFANLVQENTSIEKKKKKNPDNHLIEKDYEKNELILQKYLPQVIPKGFEVLLKKNNNNEGALFDEADDDDDDGDDNDVEESLRFMDVKIIALKLLSISAVKLGKEFMPYLDDATACIRKYCHAYLPYYYSNDDGPKVLLESIPFFYAVMQVLCCSYDVKKPKNMTEKIEMPIPLQELIQKNFRNYLMAVLKEEKESQEMISKVFSGWLNLCELYGRNMLELMSKEMYEEVLTFLNKLAPCQQSGLNKDNEDEDDEEERNDEDQDEKEEGEDEEESGDELVLHHVADFIATWVKIYGDDAKNSFDNFHSILIKYLQPSSTATKGFQSAIIACYASVIESMSPSLAEKYIPAILPFLQECLQQQSHPVLHRNAAFTVGVIVDHTTESYLLQFPEFISWLDGLLPIFNEKKDGNDLMQEDDNEDEGEDDDQEEEEEVHHSTGADMDNALSTIARIINKLFLSPASSSAPFLEVADRIDLKSLISMIFRVLPLKEDHDEGPVIYQMLSDVVLLKKHSLFFDPSDENESLLFDWIRCMADSLHPNSLATHESKKICSDALVGFSAIDESCRELLRSFVDQLEDACRQVSAEAEEEELFEVEDDIVHVQNLRKLLLSTY